MSNSHVHFGAQSGLVKETRGWYYRGKLLAVVDAGFIPGVLLSFLIVKSFPNQTPFACPELLLPLFKRYDFLFYDLSLQYSKPGQESEERFEL